MTDLPLVLQFNKRDLKNILTVDELNNDLNTNSRYPHFETSAINGDGVFETLKAITKLTLKKLRKRMASSQPGGVSPAREPVRPAMSPQRPESISAASLARAAEEGVVSSAVPEQSIPDATTPTTVAPPIPASPPRTADSDVFSTPVDQPEEPATGGPLDGAESSSIGTLEDESVSESTAEALSDSQALEEDQFASGDMIDESAVEVDGSDEPRQKEATEVSGFNDGVASEAETEIAEKVDFDQHTVDEPTPEPPPIKRVHVSNQLDILAELESLRVGSLSGGAPSHSRSSTSDLDIDSLISCAMGGAKEIRRKVEQGLDSEVFGQMRGIEVAIRVKDAGDNTIERA